MLKQVSLLKRHPRLTAAEFREYYERVHVRIGEKYLRGRAVHYMRRYLSPMPGREIEPEYDVVMEIWYPDQATFDETRAYLASAGPAAEILADEQRLFDRAKNRFFLVEEHVSDLA